MESLRVLLTWRMVVDMMHANTHRVLSAAPPVDVPPPAPQVRVVVLKDPRAAIIEGAKAETAAALGPRLWRWRSWAKLNLEQMAALLGYSKDSIRAWEKNRNPIDILAAIAYATALEITLDRLVKVDPEGFEGMDPPWVIEARKEAEREASGQRVHKKRSGTDG